MAEKRSEERLMRIRLRLLVVVLGTAVLTLAVAGGVAERSLRKRSLARVEASLLERLALTQEALAGEAVVQAARDRLQPRARQLATAAGARVTLIARDGAVVADSEVPIEELGSLENHANRPEVAAALAGGPGTDRRRSRTLLQSLLYVALPADGGGVVRLALELGEIEQAALALRRELLLAGLVALLLVALAALPATRWVLHPLRRVGERFVGLARGELDSRVGARAPDELRPALVAVTEALDTLRARLDHVSRENEQLHAVLAGMVEGVLVTDRKERVLLANPPLRELFGVWGEVESRPHWEVIRHPEVESALSAASRSDEPVLLELEIGGADGTVVEMHAVRFPKRGELRGTVAVFHDVTELRRLEGVRRAFVANVSHELRTPLTAIRGFAETLLGDGVDAQQRANFLQVILRHADRLSALIEDVLELSRIESRQLPLEPAEIDVARLGTGLLRDLGAQLTARRITAELEQEGDPRARADRRAVEQVLTNLLANAMKYTDPGGRVTVRVLGRAEGLRVEVEDSGIGIPEADLPRVFERFYRVDKARSRDLGGTGLGLAIVKHLVQAMGGDVHVRSRSGEGSCFFFTLPGPGDA